MSPTAVRPSSDDISVVKKIELTVMTCAVKRFGCSKSQSAERT